jgi:DNA end-binding protein Ku
LATLRVRDGVLVLNTMLWPDEVRKAKFDFLDEDVEARPAELAMAGSLIESMAGDFHPEAYTDNYREALQEVIDAKVSGREVVQPEEPEQAPSAAVDLMAALRASVERARAARGESDSDAGATPIGAAKSARKTAAKKAPSTAAPAKKAEPAKKATPAKTTAKKTSGTAAKKATKAASEDKPAAKKTTSRARKSA